MNYFPPYCIFFFLEFPFETIVKCIILAHLKPLPHYATRLTATRIFCLELSCTSQLQATGHVRSHETASCKGLQLLLTSCKGSTLITKRQNNRVSVSCIMWKGLYEISVLEISTVDSYIFSCSKQK